MPSIAESNVNQPLGINSSVLLQSGGTLRLAASNPSSFSTNKITTIGIGNGTVEVGLDTTVTFNGNTQRLGVENVTTSCPSLPETSWKSKA